MYHFFLFFMLLLISACTTPKINVTNEKKSETKIQMNKSTAFNAQEEYRQIQAQREKE